LLLVIEYNVYLSHNLGQFVIGSRDPSTHIAFPHFHYIPMGFDEPVRGKLSSDPLNKSRNAYHYLNYIVGTASDALCSCVFL